MRAPIHIGVGIETCTLFGVFCYQSSHLNTSFATGSLILANLFTQACDETRRITFSHLWCHHMQIRIQKTYQLSRLHLQVNTQVLHTRIDPLSGAYATKSQYSSDVGSYQSVTLLSVLPLLANRSLTNPAPYSVNCLMTFALFHCSL